VSHSFAMDPSTTPATADPELLGLPAPARRQRTALVVLMAVTAVFAVALSFAVRGDVRYALASKTPTDVGDLGALAPSPTMADKLVQADAVLAPGRALRFTRPFEGDSFQLVPVASNPRILVELRVSEGEPAIEPTSFVGRLVPAREAGLRYSGLSPSGEGAIPSDAWVLIDGSMPASASWALLLCVLLCAFAVLSVAGIARITRPVEPASDRR
jgi:hypothetical protein